MKSFSNAALTAITILFTLLLLEGLANAYLAFMADNSTFTRYAFASDLKDRYQESSRPYFSRHRYIGYINTPDFQKGKNRHNTLGYRGANFPLKKPTGEFRIVCLGGSTTYTEFVEDATQSYPAQLEKHLHQRGHKNVRVINAGAGGWSSYETLINFMLRVIETEPDLLLVYHTVNDIHPRFVWPPEAFQGDNSGRRSVTAVFTPPLLEYSALYRIIAINLGWMISHNNMLQALDNAPNTYIQPDFVIQQARGIYPQGLFRRVSAEKILQTNTFKYFRRNLDHLIALAHHHNIKVILTTQARTPAFGLRHPTTGTPEYQAAFKEADALLKDLSEKNQTHFFDLEATFPDNTQYYYDGYHLNQSGATLKAKLFADFLEKENLITSPSKL